MHLTNLIVEHLVLNLGQYERFMAVIRKLGERVEQEHKQHLRDTQRIEDRSALSPTVSTSGTTFGATLDFASLVAGATTKTVNPDVEQNGKGWDDDVWGNILSSDPEVVTLAKSIDRVILTHIIIALFTFTSSQANSPDSTTYVPSFVTTT